MRYGIVLLLACAAQAGESIAWAKDLEDAKEKAKASGRPVLAYFTFDS
jgi:hypothetical protein